MIFLFGLVEDTNLLLQNRLKKLSQNDASDEVSTIFDYRCDFGLKFFRIQALDHLNLAFIQLHYFASFYLRPKVNVKLLNAPPVFFRLQN